MITATPIQLAEYVRTQETVAVARQISDTNGRPVGKLWSARELAERELNLEWLIEGLILRNFSDKQTKHAA
jgi:hypothetical protein